MTPREHVLFGLSALILACCQAGCNASPSSPSPTPEPTAATRAPIEQNSPPGPRNPYVFFEPGDLSTSTGTTVPRLGLSTSIDIDRKTIVDSLRGALSLRRWPDLTVVATDIAIDGVGGADIATRGRTFFQLSPKAPLEDRWYAVVLESLPSQVDLPAPVESKRLQTGMVVSRFRPGSEAVLRRIRYCEPDSKNVVLLEFSEPVTIGKGAVSLSAAGLPDCEPSLASGSELTVLQHKCSTNLVHGKLSAFIGAGVKHASTGLPVAGGALSFVPSEVGFDGSCYHYHP